MGTTIKTPRLQHCRTCGQAIAADLSLSHPQLNLVAEPADGGYLLLSHLAAALTRRSGRSFTTKQAGKLVRSLGLIPTSKSVSGKALTVLEGYRLRG